VADFSVAGLHATTFDTVVSEACRIAAEGLSVKLSKVMQARQGELRFVAAVGWKEEDRERVKFAIDDSNPAGYAYQSRQSVVSNGLDIESRFRTPELFARYGISKTINVPIRGAAGYYGILEADGQGGEDFVETDTVFLEAVANVVTLTRERLELLTDVPSHAYLSNAYASAAECVVVASADGQIEYLNRRAMSELQPDGPGNLVGTSLAFLFADEDRAHILGAVASAIAGQSVRLEVEGRLGIAPSRFWDIVFSPIAQRDTVTGVACAMRDVTARREHERELSELIALQEVQIDSSSLLVREVHHRVRNSLQLVHNLLAMQAMASKEPEVREQLGVAAGRVRAIAAVHERLHDTGDDHTQLDARWFVEGLVNELRALAPHRSVRACIKDNIVVSGSRVSALGMVVAELVTNSLKYGVGLVVVELTAADDALQLVVTDEGPGFPRDLPAAQGSGLGMRLIQTYSGFGPDAISVDRSVPHGRVTVRFRQT
jgi:two-component sensor histidine kinase